MISLLTSLLINNTQEIVTKPGAVIGLEIYSNSGKQPYFHLTFNDGEKTEHWKPLAMYGCNLDCPMDHFYRYAQFVSPITGEELCSHSDGQPVTFPPVPRSSSDNSVVPPSAALNSETEVSTDETSESSGGGWSTFLITILCLACVALIIFGVAKYVKRQRRVEYFFI